MANSKSSAFPTGLVFSVLGAIFVLFLVFSSYYTVDQTERGILLRNGAIVGTAQPGLGFKVPFIDSVVDMKVTDRKVSFDQLEGYSHDQQKAHFVISVGYRIPAGKVTDVYASYQNEDGLVSRLLSPVILANSKVVIGQFTAQSAIQERNRLNAGIAEAITRAITGPVEILYVTVEDIKFSNEYEKSIEARMLAEVEVQKIKQNAEREKVNAQITVIQAQAQADSVLAASRAQAENVRMMGEAEAGRIRAKGEALRDNPALIGLTTAEKWNGILPTQMVPGSAVPFLSLK